jgi:signal transduction histidine kinase
MIRPPSAVLRVLGALLVAAVDTVLVLAAHPGAVPWWAAACGYALLAVGGRRAPIAVFTVVLSLFAAFSAAYAVLLWSGYRAGRASATRAGDAVVLGAVCGGLAAQLVVAPAGAGAAPIVTGYLVFVAMPLLVGRHQAQHELLVAALSQRNRQLVRRQELLAERERLAERLRIARDMHDALGQRLGLVSVQAAALEVADPPAEHREAIGRLARATRAAVDELHELVGALRGHEEPAPAARDAGTAGLAGLAAEFREAGVPVELSCTGEPAELTEEGWRAAHRVVQEGLTNAVKHAPGRAVTVSLAWEGDAALLTVLSRGPLRTPGAAGTAGHGLAGLRERVHGVGGLLDHGPVPEGFRLWAMLPARQEDGPEPAAGPGGPGGRPVRLAVQGLAAGLLLFVLVPGCMLVGVG